MRSIRYAIMPAFVGLAAALALAFAPAAGATTGQQITDLTGIPVDVGSLAPCLPFDLVITGNGHDHFVFSDAGVHENATVEGTGVAGPFSGHAEAWFTSNGKNGAQVNTFKAMLQLAQGTKIQQTGTFVLNANGVPVVGNLKVSCS